MTPVQCNFAYETLGRSFEVICLSRSPVGKASDFRYPAPGHAKSLCSRRFGARYIEPPDGDGLRSRQRRVLYALYVEALRSLGGLPVEDF